jgi:hypothetical protein
MGSGPALCGSLRRDGGGQNAWSQRKRQELWRQGTGRARIGIRSPLAYGGSSRPAARIILPVPQKLRGRARPVGQAGEARRH